MLRLLLLLLLSMEPTISFRALEPSHRPTLGAVEEALAVYARGNMVSTLRWADVSVLSDWYPREMVIDIHYSLDDRRELRVVELRFRQYRKGDWFLGVKSKPKAL